MCWFWEVGVGSFAPVALLWPWHCPISSNSRALVLQLIWLSQLSPSICDRPIAPCLTSIIWCSGFTTVLSTFIVFLFCAAFVKCPVMLYPLAGFYIKIGLWSDQPILTNINFPPLFVSSFLGFSGSNVCLSWKGKNHNASIIVFIVYDIMHSL